MFSSLGTAGTVKPTGMCPGKGKERKGKERKGKRALRWTRKLPAAHPLWRWMRVCLGADLGIAAIAGDGQAQRGVGHKLQGVQQDGKGGQVRLPYHLLAGCRQERSGGHRLNPAPAATEVVGIAARACMHAYMHACMRTCVLMCLRQVTTGPLKMSGRPRCGVRICKGVPR